MRRKILLAAGGTGGHVIPAIAFGQWLAASGESVSWLTGSRALEDEIFKAHGVQPEKLPLEGSPLGVSGVRSLKRWWQLFRSFFISRSLLKSKKVDCCVVFGGYLSMPVLLAAKSLGIPIVIHEQNAVAGKVTRLAACLGVPVACAWKECLGLRPEQRLTTGMPMRSIVLTERRAAQRELLGAELPEGEKLLVILGGSLGSGGMKNLLQDAQNMIKSTGCSVLCMGIAPEQRPFPDALTHEACWDMSPVYSAADALICRAGASTLAEIAALGIPALVAPWAKAAENHQAVNAQVFSALTGARILSEDSTPEEFHAALTSLPERRPPVEDMSAGCADLYRVLCSITA